MNCSDVIELISLIVSFGIGIASIIISVNTLKQNSKMIEESTRPNIVVYGKKVYFCTLKYVLIIKNFGSSSATITDFSCDKNLKDYSLIKNVAPFDHIIGSTLVPGQCIFCDLDVEKLKNKKVNNISFVISYEGIKKYSDNKFTVNIYAELENTIGHRHAKEELSNYDKLNEEIKLISDTLSGIGEEISLK